MKSKENKNYLLRAKNQNLITKSDLSNKIKLNNKLNRSGSELKSYLLNENSCNIKLETSINVNNSNINVEDNNPNVNNNNNEINIISNEQQQQQPKQSKSLIYTEIIKRVLKMKKSS